jgi:hypothetical protein
MPTNTYSPLTRPAAMMAGGALSAATAKSQPVIVFETKNFNDESVTSKVPDELKDWRVRISLPPGNDKSLYKALDPNGESLLKAADGVLFPYTPTMTTTFNARYQEQSLTHSNYKGYFYEGSDIAPITLTGTFTAQNEVEAAYVQSAVMFLRAVTKMRFGKNDPKAGQPPTLVRLSGYGSFYMPAVTCVVTQFSHTMPEDVDYIPFKNGDKQGWIPTTSQITVTLQPIFSRSRQASNFSLEDLVGGKALSNGTYSISTRNDNTGGMI